MTPLGITFSHRQLQYLDLPVEESLQTALQLNFSHLRLGCYWDENEPQPGQYDFSSLHQILKTCQRHQRPVVLTIGVKAPRWPEFYWPKFIPPQEQNFQKPKTQQQIINFITTAVKELQTYDCLTHWQVENEPLDPSGPDNLAIPLSFLRQETELVRQLDDRPIIINLWGNDLLTRQLLPLAEAIADVIGLDLYSQQFVTKIFKKNIYRGYLHPQQRLKQLQQTLKQCSKPTWITELQAEPWEDSEKNYKKPAPASISPQKLTQNIEQAQKLPIKNILLWGFEYWLWRASQGDNRYLDLISKINQI